MLFPSLSYRDVPVSSVYGFYVCPYTSLLTNFIKFSFFLPSALFTLIIHTDGSNSTIQGLSNQLNSIIPLISNHTNMFSHKCLVILKVSKSLFPVSIPLPLGD